MSTQALEQAAQRSSGVSILHDTQHTSGQGSGQPVLVDPTLGRGHWNNNIQRCLPTSTIVWLCG